MRRFKFLNILILQIPVGTSDQQIPPSESNKLLQDWDEIRGNYNEIHVDEVLEGVVECPLNAHPSHSVSCLDIHFSHVLLNKST